MTPKRQYFFLGLLLFGWINFPDEKINQIRSCMAASFSWQDMPGQFNERDFPNECLNQTRLATLHAMLMDDERLTSRANFFGELLKKDKNVLKEDAKKRIERELHLLELQYSSLTGQVIFREPSTWNHTVWVSVGENDNDAFHRTIVALNSPVLSRGALVGVVEYVGKTQSRVRLITDAGLSIAVRAVRGGAQNRELVHLVEELFHQIQSREDLFSLPEEKNHFVETLMAMQKRLNVWDDEEMAKGEISGCSFGLNRSKCQHLLGVGWNCDFADENGVARDLRSGLPIHNLSGAPVSLLKQGDLLITSGLDGVFPPGIPVALATKIFPLTEGSISYRLEAASIAGDLLDLHTVSVLPPLNGGVE